MEYREMGLKKLRLMFQQYADLDIHLKDEQVAKIYRFASKNKLIEHSLFGIWMKQYEVKQMQFLRGQRDGTFINNWKFINDIVMGYKVNPSARKLTFLKKSFIILLGRIYTLKIAYVGINLQKKRMGKNYGMPYPFTLEPKSLNDILLEWIFCKTDTKKRIYGKDLLNRFNPSKCKNFSTYFYFNFSKDLRNISKWAMIKKYHLKHKTNWKFKDGYFIITGRVGYHTFTLK